MLFLLFYFLQLLFQRAVSCFQTCVLLLSSTHLSPQNSFSKSAPLTFVKLFFYCCCRSHNLHRFHTQGRERTELLYMQFHTCLNLFSGTECFLQSFYYLLLFLFPLQLELCSFPGASLPFLSASPTLLLSSSLNLASPSNLSCFPSPLLVQFTV